MCSDVSVESSGFYLLYLCLKNGLRSQPGFLKNATLAVAVDRQNSCLRFDSLYN